MCNILLCKYTMIFKHIIVVNGHLGCRNIFIIMNSTAMIISYMCKSLS